MVSTGDTWMYSAWGKVHRRIHDQMNPEQIEAWINEPARQTPVRHAYDVVVAGGGTSGLCAAIAAARSGARTLLIERYAFCGGNATIYLPLLSFLDQQGNEVIKGIGKEIIDRVIELGGCVGHGCDPLHISYAPVDPEIFKRVVIEELEKAGVDVLLHSLVVDVQSVAVEGELDTPPGPKAAGEQGGGRRRITHLLIENKSGRSAVAGEWFIDGTGDGDVAYLAGATWEKGNAHGQMQPATLMFRMSGVDIAKTRLAIAADPQRFGCDLIPAEHYVRTDNFIVVGMREVLEEAKAAGDFPLHNNRVIFITQPRPGEVAVNMTRVLIDATDAEDLSRGEMQARKDVWVVEKFLREYIPGFEDAYVIDTAHRLGIRETRRIIGEYILDRDDILESRRFDDCITVASYPIDLHHPNGPDCTLEHPKDTYDIPYRSLVPLGVANLLVVGRCISATHEAMAAIRVMPIGMALGHAGGAAAAIAFKERHKDVREVSTRALQQLLLAQGARITVPQASAGSTA